MFGNVIEVLLTSHSVCDHANEAGRARDSQHYGVYSMCERMYALLTPSRPVVAAQAEVAELRRQLEKTGLLAAANKDLEATNTSLTRAMVRARMFITTRITSLAGCFQDHDV